MRFDDAVEVSVVGVLVFWVVEPPIAFSNAARVEWSVEPE